LNSHAFLKIIKLFSFIKNGYIFVSTFTQCCNLEDGGAMPFPKYYQRGNSVPMIGTSVWRVRRFCSEVFHKNFSSSVFSETEHVFANRTPGSAFA